jgi:hypothetical protein
MPDVHFEGIEQFEIEKESLARVGTVPGWAALV